MVIPFSLVLPDRQGPIVLTSYSSPVLPGTRRGGTPANGDKARLHAHFCERVHRSWFVSNSQMVGLPRPHPALH
jgi:hypothetical protein